MALRNKNAEVSDFIAKVMKEFDIDEFKIIWNSLDWC